jgi:hypothetical protein
VAVHIYTQRIHRTTQITTNVEECGPCLVFASFTLAFVLQLRKEYGKTSVRVRKNLSEVKKNLSQSTIYVLPKHPHITKLHPHIIKSTRLFKKLKFFMIGEKYIYVGKNWPAIDVGPAGRRQLITTSKCCGIGIVITADCSSYLANATYCPQYFNLTCFSILR